MEQFYIINKNDNLLIKSKEVDSIFVYKKSTDTNIASNQIQLIEKLIVNGLKLKMDEILLIDLATEKLKFRDIQHKYNIKNCILLGDVETIFGLNFQLPSYQLKKVGSTFFLKSATAETLHTNAALKTKFWTALKELFKID